jgi:hypothetical protein
MTYREPSRFQDRCTDCDRIIAEGEISVWFESEHADAAIGPFCNVCCPPRPERQPSWMREGEDTTP